jgi:hypothetical protein
MLPSILDYKPGDNHYCRDLKTHDLLNAKFQDGYVVKHQPKPQNLGLSKSYNLGNRAKVLSTSNTKDSTADQLSNG